MKNLIFFGAGASKSEGAPLQNEIFRIYSELIRKAKDHDEIHREIATFFWDFFGINCDHGDLTKIVFPTFEEVIGVVDLAYERNESLKNYDNINRATNSNRLGLLRLYLVLVLARTIGDKLKKDKGTHKELIENLEKKGKLNDSKFVSTNYDILIDNALADLHPRISLDYGIEFKNFDLPHDWSRPKEPSQLLLKIHGSLNWLFCPTCNTVTLTPYEKGVIELVTNITECYCKDCDTVFSPIIIPPTFYKDFANIFIQNVWHNTEKVMRESDHIVFCGYSFPEADMHIKYLLKRAQTNKKRKTKYTVINNHLGKSDEIKKMEKERFTRFLGSVDYTDLSFEDFCKHPEKIL